MTDVELARNFDVVAWEVEPRAENLLRQLPQMTAEVVFYAAREVLRNAERYGRGDQPGPVLQLRVSVMLDGMEQDGTKRRSFRTLNAQIIIEDDGAGLRSEARAESHGGGSGQGLALHSTMMVVIGGSLSVDSRAGAGTRVTLSLPNL